MGTISALVFYVIPGLIGRAYDLKNNTIGPDLFYVNETQQARVIQRFITTSEYRMVSDISEAHDFLDVDGKLALKLKTGSSHLEGTGHYLKEATSFENRVDLLVKVHYETVIHTLPSNIKPLPDWEKYIERTGSTHYIRSIKYGGDLIASLSFYSSKKENKRLIEGALQGELGTKSGSFGIGLDGKLKKIENETKETSSMNINYYATVPLHNIARTIDGLMKLVQEFPDQTKKVNGGWGVPLEMEVFSLESLSKGVKSYTQSQAFEGLLDLLNEQFTDIRTSRRLLSDWLKSIPPVLDDKMNHKISNYTTKLDELNKIFCQVIGNLDLSSEGSADQFQAAFNAYQGDGKMLYPNFYENKLSFLKEEVYLNTPAFEADFGGNYFTYFGNGECPLNTSFVYGGKTATVTRNSVGSSKFTCFPKDSQLIPDTIGNVEEFQTLTQVLPVAFVSRNHGTTTHIPCSSCRIPGKTTVTMLPGHQHCPQNWTQQYNGVLVSSDFQSARGELICVDPSKGIPIEQQDDAATIVTEVSPACDNFPCSGSVASNKGIPCVVCSIKKEETSPAEVYRFDN